MVRLHFDVGCALLRNPKETDIRRRSMASLYENKATVVIAVVLLLYFLWMDIALFYHVNNRTIEHKNAGETSPAPSTPVSVPHLISPFTGLSVKMMMMDPVNNYIFTPAALIFNEVTKFSTIFYFITPNMVSFIGILFAIGGGKCMCLDSRIYHCLAIFLFQIRTFCDALDGIVARCRIGMIQHVSLRNTSGYVVDGVADALGFTAFLIGCFQYLRTVVPKHKYYLPLSTNETCKECKDSNSNGGSPQNNLISNASTQRRVFYVVLCFGLQMAIGAFFWDHYINAYHNLLETNAPTEAQTAAQNDVLRSSITWILMWFWRLSNAHTFIQFLLFAIYINKLWGDREGEEKDEVERRIMVGFCKIFPLRIFRERGQMRMPHAFGRGPGKHEGGRGRGSVTSGGEGEEHSGTIGKQNLPLQMERSGGVLDGGGGLDNEKEKSSRYEI
ncbi:Ceramide phosphoethanolamine synthase like protein [Argiope bruennichi]|uniref:Ceramide phosphoethanolamine synthase like protein n=1 Tax=Argiope bruennichi TaxID=94029 RepID=A0A8T0G1L6_ARGBR|nr:Ceramide phosphoethanolamine synthase like protein [Argiope bruennichi]